MTILQVPIIDISGLIAQTNNSADVVAGQIRQAAFSRC
jgi:hypothetical protein